MSKVKAPFLSLGSQGSIADALTTQRYPASTIIRKKPTPAYRQTLPQMYQRWLYEGYSHLWTQQSQSTKQTYATAGSRFHLTGFQYWMKYCLSNLPYIAGLWHCDYQDFPVCYDHSLNGNDGTVIGAYGVPGLIQAGAHFDGVNDEIQCGNDPSLQLTNDFTLEFFHRSLFLGVITDGVTKFVRFPSRNGFTIYHTDTNHYFFWLANADVTDGVLSDNPIADTAWHHIAGRRLNGKSHLFIDGVKQAGSTNFAPADSSDQFVIGKLYSDRPPYSACEVDMVILHSRGLTDAEILRNSLRRYPP